MKSDRVAGKEKRGGARIKRTRGSHKAKKRTHLQSPNGEKGVTSDPQQTIVKVDYGCEKRARAGTSVRG